MTKISRIISGMTALGLIFSLALGFNKQLQAFGTSEATSETSTNSETSETSVDDQLRLNRVEENLTDLSFQYESYRLYARVNTPSPVKVYGFRLGYRNFEEGITEEMADEAAKTYGEVEDVSDWMIELSHSKYKNGADRGELLSVSFGLRALRENLTGEYYYAMKIADPDDLDHATWVRGKLSYRVCTKSPLFKENTTTCLLVQNGDTYEPVLKSLSNQQVLPLPEGASIPDWDTEWRDVLKDRFEKFDTLLRGLNQYVRGFEYYAGQVDKSITNLEKVIDTATDVDDIKRNLPGSRTNLESLLEYYNGLKSDPNASAKITELEERIRTLEGQNANLTENITSLQTEKQELADQVNNLTSEKQELAAQVNDLASEKQQLEHSLADANSENQRLTEEIAALKGAGSSPSETLKELAKKNQELEETVKNLQNQNSSLLGSLADLKDKNTGLSGTLSNLQNQNTELNSSLSDSQSKNTKLDEKIATLTSEKMELEKKVSEATNSLIKVQLKSSKGESEKAPTDQKNLNSNLTTQITEDASNSSDDNNLAGQNQNEATSSEEIGVPKLGENPAWKWVGVGLIALASGLLVLWVKRAFLSKNKS